MRLGLRHIWSRQHQHKNWVATAIVIFTIGCLVSLWVVTPTLHWMIGPARVISQYLQLYSTACIKHIPQSRFLLFWIWLGNPLLSPSQCDFASWLFVHVHQSTLVSLACKRQLACSEVIWIAWQMKPTASWISTWCLPQSLCISAGRSISERFLRFIYYWSKVCTRE